MFEETFKFIKSLYPNMNEVHLHEPSFDEGDKKILNKVIESTYVSSDGEYIEKFERKIASFTGAKYAVLTSSGTSALHLALRALDVEEGHEVLTQPLTFVATCNAISYCNATPIFIDVSLETMGMCPEKLIDWLKVNTFQRNKKCINKFSMRTISACLPVHTFGNPTEIDKISSICKKYNIGLIEDCAESLGSFYRKKHTGTYGKIGTLSFNGNKIITTGGGGAIITNNRKIAKEIKHLSSTAKQKHQWEFIHDKIGFNYRMPNLNAALGFTQMNKIKKYLKDKKKVRNSYKDYFNGIKKIKFFEPTKNSDPNFWLNVIFLPNTSQRNIFLKKANENKIYCRAAWKLMPDLKLYEENKNYKVINAKKIYDTAVLLPSSPRT
tara:strand:- start:19711 stop:20853 length:1143 start_codon:yes stop_codon:yes gene_type:complete